MSIFVQSVRHGAVAARLAIVALVSLAASAAVAQPRRPDPTSLLAGPEAALATDPDMRRERMPGRTRRIAAAANDRST
jgi:hypothetical protein